MRGTRLFALGIAALPFLAASLNLGKEGPDFVSDIEPVLRSQCYGCHGASTQSANLRLDTAAGIASVVVPGDPAKSKLIQRLRGKPGTTMPLGMTPLSDAKVKLLTQWVSAGASTKLHVPLGTIMPFLKGSCGSCHSGASPAGGLDLMTPEGIAKGGVSGPAFIAGDPEQSLIMRRLQGMDGLPQMPKGFASIPESRLKTVRDWISAGANLSLESGSSFWAYRPITRPTPVTVKSDWARNPIDFFIQDQLIENGLKFSPEASRETLIRRLSLDLIGLPPSPEEVQAFLADKSPAAYEKLVDRLLASTHYGEKQARLWLDLARYADSNGYEADRIRSAYLYRDWVINAFNSNMPYDRFTIEQVAGDLLPGATTDTQIATGFNRNTMWNLEGGVDPDEARYEMINDRVATTTTVWLGQTYACARCHDHKYDPISQKDYFQMYAYFANTKYTVNGDKKINTPTYSEPAMAVPTQEQKTQESNLTKQVAALKASLNQDSPDLDRDRAEWLRALRDGVTWSSKPTAATAQKATLTVGEGNVIVASGENPERTRYRITLANPGATSLRIEAIPEKTMKMGGPGRSSSGNFILSKVWVESGGKQIQASSAAVSYIQDGYTVEGVLDDNSETGWAIYPKYDKAATLLVTFDKPLPGATVDVVLDFGSMAWPEHTLGSFRVSLTSDPQAGVELASPDLKVLAGKANRTPEEEAKLKAAHRVVARSLASIRKQISTAEADLGRVRGAIPYALVLSETPTLKPLTANIHVRGEFLSPAQEVTAGTPEFLPPMNQGAQGNRLGLARWLVNKDNPLAARVQANRMWEMIFGRGLVETSENFGTQGSPPTHPELLDWLACELRDNGWNLKALYKKIVMSATYRQTSKTTKELLAKDPQNVWLARGPRFRLEAEAIRDVALSAAGLLSMKVGGPSVFPSQPVGIWDSPYNGEQWMESKGEDRYRRGLYTFWKRTATYPSFAAMDATSREQCTVRRIRTNTPLQSLALMNDPGMMEAAVALGGRMAKAGSDKAGIELGFRLCTSRSPAPGELERMQNLLNQLRTIYAKKPEAVKALGGDVRQASWTLLGNVLLNLDETITKE